MADIETVAFLAAADEFAGLLVAFYDFRDVFETCEDIVNLHAEALGDLRDEFGGHDGLDYVCLGCELAEFLPTCEDVVGKHCTGLVAVELDHLAVIVTDCDTHAVSIRVCREHDVSALTVSDFQRHLHGCRLLRIW